MNQTDSKTFRLFNSQPSFSKGWGRIFDFSGALDKDSYNTSRTSKQADREAIRSDWEAVGEDLKITLKEY